MNGVAVLKLALESVSRELERELDGLTANQLVYRPTDEANTIGFTAWHIIRMLDGAATRVVPMKDDAPLIWERDGWYERFGMEAEDSGTVLGAPKTKKSNTAAVAAILNDDEMASEGDEEASDNG
ncbi:MAG: DinB family protein, partial [Dehalococcoidia bacterium]|nr:DinB family protein [Dehalococcoidia bacterium]